MAITLEVQPLVQAARAFTVRLTGVAGARGVVRLFVDDVPREFRFFPKQAAGREQTVYLFMNQRTSSVLEDWGSAADAGHKLGVQVDDQPVQEQLIG